MTIYHEYESIFITRPELPEDEVKRLDEKFQNIIESREGSILVFEDWGRRKMAYDIKKHGHGRYTYFNFVGPASLPSEIERNVKIEDNLIRFMTIKLADSVDVEERRVIAEERTRKRAEKLAAEKLAEAERLRMDGERERRRSEYSSDRGPRSSDSDSDGDSIRGDDRFHGGTDSNHPADS